MTAMKFRPFVQFLKQITMLCLDDLDCDLLTFIIFEAALMIIGPLKFKLILFNLKNLIYRLQISKLPLVHNPQVSILGPHGPLVY